ncbi:beta-1,6-N-acetylglucosaminyltransferase [Moraxella sp. PS-22]|uniref:Peptide O-xylosyltransferase n=1 Tax=Moraxella tetraodonis TaxID=2767221 RepID=A0A9X1US69_9GAMM|nr:beta-1,6-N-acetylglucosaminyltransferase [Moraxella tetraodonis]MCG8148056.1 beta-1,6-N-acetylglucosaminyltransferase [Moraxella tetraodonis]
MKKHALLIQAHQDISYFIKLAKIQPNVNFYVHIDAKSDYFPDAETAQLANVFLLKDRITVRWGGFSQIEATLKLFETAFVNEDNAYFHLVSGEDVVLQPFEVIEKQWQQRFDFQAMMACKLAPECAYRFIMDSPHADSNWQRQLTGKIITKLQQGVAKIKTYHSPIYFGSQWFSVTRADWEKIMPFTDEYSDFFRQKLVPDEHFFQTLITEKLTNQIRLSNDNRRQIIFDKNVNNGNSPIYLDLLKLEQAKFNGYWFARKVKKDVALTWVGELT